MFPAAGSESDPRAERVSNTDDWRDSTFEDRILSLCDPDLDHVAASSSSASAWSLHDTDFGSVVDKLTWDKLFAYQKEGIKWMHSLYSEGLGGILGDEMGLGKTCQLCTHFGSLAYDILRNKGESIQFTANRGHTSRASTEIMKRPVFLVVCPPTVLQHWRREMARWCPRMRTIVFHSMQQLHEIKVRGVESSISKLRSHQWAIGLCVLISYEGLRMYKSACSSIEWTAVCLDEGQKIRNPEADITSACKMLPCYHRLILTGTPIQNNLSELWSLIDFICPGKLGSLTVFELEFCEPIRAGGYAGSTILQKEVAVRTATTLQRIVKPFLLRRKKAEIAEVAEMLPPKTEHVLFCTISPLQRAVYNQILDSPEVGRILRNKQPAFAALTTLRKLCNHPTLAFRKGRVVWDTNAAKTSGRPKTVPEAGKKRKLSNVDASQRDYGGEEIASDDDAADIGEQPALDEVNWDDSGKLFVLKQVLPLWKAAGHKVLLFSQTQSMLNLLEKLLLDWSRKGYISSEAEARGDIDSIRGSTSPANREPLRFSRLDGSTPMHKRDAIINAFNTDPSIFLMLLTTRTGGVGISLTAANRVVILDPDWNPQTDVQARERAWRLGQEREVTIYRLLTRGTIEEKIYQRQIFKILLSNRILDAPRQRAMFSKSDMRELFTLSDEVEAPVGVKPMALRAEEDKQSTLPISGHVDLSSSDFDEGDERMFQYTIQNTSEAEASFDEGFMGRDFEGELGIEKIPTSSSSTSSSSASSSSTSSSSSLTDTSAQLKSISSSPSSSLATPLRAARSIATNRSIPDTSSAIRARGQTHFTPSRNNTQSEDKDKDNASLDRKLLIALINGDSVSCVYDHGHLENGGDDRDRDRLGRQASRRVQEATIALTESGQRRVLGARALRTSTSVSTSSFLSPNSSSSMALTSSALLSNLRQRTGERLSQEQVPLRESLKTDIIALFQQSRFRGGIRTEQFLDHFGTLGDHYAVLFRDTLREVAVMSDGVWVLRQFANS